MNQDQSLAQQDPQSPAGTPFGDPDGAPSVRLPMSIEDVLASAKRVEKTARICTRADLQAEHDELREELMTLVNAQGELLVDDEASMGDESPTARAQEINDRLTALGRQMAGAMWSVRFRAMPSDDWAVFVKKNLPKGDNEDLTEFNTLLIAECAVAPELTLDQVRELRKVLGSPQVKELANKAWQANTTGGLDVPKLPVSLQAMTRQ